MAKTVLFGCKLPHGIILRGTRGQQIVLNGLNTSLIPGGFGITHVDEIEVEYIKAAYKDFAPFKSQAIFTPGSSKVSDAAAMARELTDERTGFEGVNPDAPAPNLKPEDGVDKALEMAERADAARPRKAPTAPADKAAANELAGNA